MKEGRQRRWGAGHTAAVFYVVTGEGPGTSHADGRSPKLEERRYESPLPRRSNFQAPCLSGCAAGYCTIPDTLPLA